MSETTPVVLTLIRKRNGTTVPFNLNKIFIAISKAMKHAGEFQENTAHTIAKMIEKRLIKKKKINKNFMPTVEGIQDEVERVLMEEGFSATAKAYIIYREERSKERSEYGEVPSHVRALSAESKKYFQNNSLGEFVYLRTYARWIEEENRRETWVETVDRYVSFMKENLGDKLTNKEYTEVREAILKQEVMPSMRLMQFSGAPARRCNTCAYNCTFTAPERLEDFAEIMYLSMQGCGVGFSVESQTIERLPQISKETRKKIKIHVIDDSKEGWCDALTLGLKTWFSGNDIDFDYSQIRSAGARLKVMGGKASGPEPLRALLQFAKEKIKNRQGRRLRSIDAHDIICKIGECVVSGGVRRTAMISLSDLDDIEVRDAKKGQFFINSPHRMVANNSAIYEKRPSNTELMEEWLALANSGTGERGIFNRGSIAHTMPERRKKYFHARGFLNKDGIIEGSIGTNPCGEIILQSKEFCNLSEVIARDGDTKETLIRKGRLAALLGTYQASLTNFKYISKEWVTHCKDEALLGVSITGQWDSEVAREPETLRAIRDIAIETNKVYAKRFGIKQATSVTAVKPSGTVSQTFNCSSGIHPRYSRYYIRRVRISATDSLFKMLRDQGVPYYPEVGQTKENASTYVLEFPVESPDSVKFKDDFSALEQLEYWKTVKLNYTEHNPSTTINVKEDEWIPILNWLQKNWDIVGGLSFLPHENHVYRLAPYETITKKQYKEMISSLPSIDYSKLLTYERTDETEQKKELACVGGLCDVDMIVPEEEVKTNV